MTALGPDFIALQVRDLEASAAFYTEHLGLARAQVSPDHAVVFATEPIAFAVREPLVDLEAVEHLGWGVAIWLKADDPRICTMQWFSPESRSWSHLSMDLSVVRSPLPIPTATP
jgi:hypothetical protein